MGGREPHDVLQGEMPSPAPGKEQPRAPGQAGGCPAGNSLSGKESLSLEMLKKLVEHHPEQPAVADPALSKRVGVDRPRGADWPQVFCETREQQGPGRCKI